MTVKVEFITDQFQGVLLAYNARKRAIPLDVIAQSLITAIDDRLQSEGNGQWLPLQNTTLERHPNRLGGSLLQDTGLLAQIQQSPGSPNPNWVEVMSPAKYAIYHTSDRPRKVIPLRDFLAIDMPRVLEQIGNTLLAEIDR